MGKKFWLGFIVSCVLLVILQYVYHAFILSGFYLTHTPGFRPEEYCNRFMFWIYVAMALHAFIWTYLYNRYVPVKNLRSGAEFGVILMIFFYVPTGFYNYSLYIMSGYVYLWCLVGGLVMGAVIGGVMGTLMKAKAAAAA